MEVFDLFICLLNTVIHQVVAAFHGVDPFQFIQCFVVIYDI